jgi:hypothetical protein
VTLHKLIHSLDHSLSSVKWKWSQMVTNISQLLKLMIVKAGINLSKVMEIPNPCIFISYL